MKLLWFLMLWLSSLLKSSVPKILFFTKFVKWFFNHYSFHSFYMFCLEWLLPHIVMYTWWFCIWDLMYCFCVWYILLWFKNLLELSIFVLFMIVSLFLVRLIMYRIIITNHSSLLWVDLFPFPILSETYGLSHLCMIIYLNFIYC